MTVTRVTTPDDAGKYPDWMRHAEQGEIEAYEIFVSERQIHMDIAKSLTGKAHEIRDRVKSRGRYRDRNRQAIRSITERIGAGE